MVDPGRLECSIKIHEDDLRDMKLSISNPDLLLTASQDRTMRLLSFNSLKPLTQIRTPTPIWSCEWDPCDSNYFFCGASSGSVRLFDLRKSSECVSILSKGKIQDPVHSICSVNHNNRLALLVGTMNGVFLIRSGDKTRWGEECDVVSFQSIDLAGSCISTTYDANSGYGLASFRQSVYCESTVADSGNTMVRRRSKGVIFRLPEYGQAPEDMNLKVVSRFRGMENRLIFARSAVCSVENMVYALCTDEISQSVWVWDALSSVRLCELPCHTTPVLSTKGICVNNRMLVGCLSHLEFRLYSV